MVTNCILVTMEFSFVFCWIFISYTRQTFCCCVYGLVDIQWIVQKSTLIVCPLTHSFRLDLPRMILLSSATAYACGRPFHIASALLELLPLIIQAQQRRRHVFFFPAPSSLQITLPAMLASYASILCYY